MRRMSLKTPAIIRAESFKITANELKMLMELRGQEACEKLQTAYNGVLGLCSLLQTSPTEGLCEPEEALEQRRRVFGANVIPPKRAKSFLQLAWDAVQDVTLLILFIASIFSLALSFYSVPDPQEDKTANESNWADGLAILMAIIVVVIVTAFNDWKKEKQFRGLQNKIESEQKQATVRQGIVEQIPIKSLVVGDICCIKYGDLLHADGVLLQSSDLKIDESSLTGESDIMQKDENDPMLLSGTRVMEGSGRMVVTAVGENSQAGIIYSLLGASEKPEPCDELPKNEENEAEKSSVATVKFSKSTEKSFQKHRSILQAKLNTMAIQIGYMGTIVAFLTFAILIIRFSIKKYAIDQNGWKNEDIHSMIEFFITGITVLVVAVPEGLPLAVTIALAYSVRKMMSDNNLVRHLDACETMGNATAICSDKTGTLTTNRMTVVRAYICGKLFTQLEDCNNLPGSFKLLLARAISINSGYTSKIERAKKPGELPRQIGNKTECALLGFVEHLNHDYEQLRTELTEQTLTKQYTFNSMRKSMSTVLEVNGNGYQLLTKGASEIILEKCSWISGTNCTIQAFNRKEKDILIRKVIQVMASDGLRTLCIAYRNFFPANQYSIDVPNVECFEQEPDWEDEMNIVSKLTCLAIIGIEDPLRPEVPDAIRSCKEAGITIRMLTGDNINTARSIAQKCGIFDPDKDHLVLEGRQFNAMIRDNPNGPVNQEKFDNIWPRLRVMARSSPQDKYLLVKGIIESNASTKKEVVAVTGDGTNDGPALKVADVGFAMGIAGTDIAKEASDIILLDDNFSSIVKAVMWGRNVYDSIAKFIQFQLTVNVVAILVAFVGACSIDTVPLAAIQMLWINLVMDTFASLALATELPTKDLLKRKPYGRNDSIISISMAVNIGMHAIYQLTVIFIILFKGPDMFDIDCGYVLEEDELEAREPFHFTIIFNVLVMMTLFNELNCRQIRRIRNVFRGMLSSQMFLWIWIFTFAVQVIIIQFGSIAFHTCPLTVDQWGWCLTFGAGELLWHQINLSLPIPDLVRKLLTKVLKIQFQEDVQRLSDTQKVVTKSAYLWLRGARRVSTQIRVVQAFQATHVSSIREAVLRSASSQKLKTVVNHQHVLQ